MNFLTLSILVFGIGLYVGAGAPGWPVKPESGGRLRKRSINPIAWRRAPQREQQRPRAMGESRINLRR